MRILASLNSKCLSTNESFLTTPFKSIVAIATLHLNLIIVCVIAFLFRAGVLKRTLYHLYLHHTYHAVSSSPVTHTALSAVIELRVILRSEVLFTVLLIIFV